MSVNKVVYDGRTLIDISDSTIESSNMLEGVIGYGANGERRIGTLNVDDMYTTGRKITVLLPVSSWIMNDGVYTQTVIGNVNSFENGFAQVLLSDDSETRSKEVAADEQLSRVELLDGSITVESLELPEVSLTLEIAIINQLTSSSKSAIACTNSKHFAFTLNADDWSKSGETYRQSVTVSGLTDDIVYGDVLLEDDDSVSVDIISEARAVSKFEVTAGGIEAICFDNPPEKDLNYIIKLFNEE